LQELISAESTRAQATSTRLSGLSSTLTDQKKISSGALARVELLNHQMAALRQSIYNGDCSCPMANASYANMLLHPPTLAAVVRDTLRR